MNTTLTPESERRVELLRAAYLRGSLDRRYATPPPNYHDPELRSAYTEGWRDTDVQDNFEEFT